jgi:hypothetical protein
VPIPPEDNPGTTPIEVANAIVRGDDFAANPAAARVAEQFQLAGSDPESGRDPFDVVHRQEPDADSNDSGTPGPNATEKEQEYIRLASAPRVEGHGTLGGTDPSAQSTDLGTTTTSSNESEEAPSPEPTAAPSTPAPEAAAPAQADTTPSDSAPAEPAQLEPADGEPSSEPDDIDRLSGADLDKAVSDVGIDASKGGSKQDGGLTADEKRAALRAKRSGS